MRALKTGLLSCVAAAALAGPAAAEAGEAPTPPPVEVEELVITGAPYGVTQRATLLAIEVLDEEDLATAPPTGLGEAVAGLPGVRSSSFSAGASRPVIRGLSGPRVQVLANGVGLIDASALSPDHQSAADPGDATRIEVLRGPSALAYGGTAIGGVVNVIDGRIPELAPAGGLEGRITVQGASVDDSVAASARLTASVGPLVVALDAQRREAGDYDIPVPAESRRLREAEGEPPEPRVGATLENSFANLSSHGAGLSWVGPRGHFGVSVRRTRSDYGVPGHRHAHAHDHDDHDDHDHDEDADVVIDLRQTRWDARGEWALDLGPFERLRFAGGWADYEHLELEGDAVGARIWSDGVEGRLELVQRPRESGWRGAVGVQALRRDLAVEGAEAYVPPTRVREFGAFVLQRLDRGRTGLEGGLRIDTRALETDTDSRDFTNVSVSAGVFYRPAEDWFLGLSVSRNGRAPTEAELFADGPHAATRAWEIGDPDIGSETVTSVEGTIHFDRGPFTADLHLFAARYDGFIDLAATGAERDGLSEQRYVQTDARFHGFEAEASYLVWREGPDRRLVLEAAADYVRGATDLGPPARIPPWSVTLRGELELDRWTGRLELREVGRQDRVAEVELPTDGYRTVNAFVSWRPDPAGGLVLFAEARNLNDAEIREHASFLKDLAPQPGRSIRLGATYRF